MVDIFTGTKEYLLQYMDTKIMAQIKKDLLQKRIEVMAELASFTKEDKHTKATRRTNFTDLGVANDDNAKEVDIYTTNLSVSKVLAGALKDIDAALKCMEKGTYGICKYCGSEINPKRLLARPVSSACVACKSKLQKSV